MKNKLICSILTVSMLFSLCSCGKKQDDSIPTSANSTDESLPVSTEISDSGSATETTEYSGGNPWVNSDIDENVVDNYDVDLKDDFALATNKDWILANQPKDGQEYAVYLNSFEDELSSRLIGIATDDSYNGNHDAELISSYYNSFLDWDARNEAGINPIIPYLDAINDIDSIDSLFSYVSQCEVGFADIAPWSILASPEDSTLNIVYLIGPNFFLNDTVDYENLDNMDEYTQLTYDCEKKMVKAVLSRYGYSDSEIDDIFEGSIEFEKLFTQYLYSNDEYYLTETTSTINSQTYTLEELSQFEGIDFYLDSLEFWGVTDIPEFLLYDNIEYFNHLKDIFCEENLDIIKDYFLAHTAEGAIDYLDKDLFYEYLDITNELYGSTGYKSDKEYAIDEIATFLGWPLSKLYCEKYVTPEDKENVYNVITEIIDEYKIMLSEEEFLSDETIDYAIKKLNNIEIKCMYPDTWYDYSELELSDSYFDNMVDVTIFESNRMVEDFHDPIDRTKWTSTPITSNAFYNTLDNSITILPGFIGDVLYRADMDKEKVYAMLGMIVGHEISHGFDPNGAMYDVEGNFKDWWTSEDKDAFKTYTDKLVEYYDNITIWNGLNCNGELVKGEACADMAAMSCILHLAANDPDFDYDLFFKTYTQMWATNSTPYNDLYCASYDVHPLGYLRVNVVIAQFDEFYETYEIKEGDGMYIAPEDRVKIW